jgi:hypothetical protein
LGVGWAITAPKLKEFVRRHSIAPRNWTDPLHDLSTGKWIRDLERGTSDNFPLKKKAETITRLSQLLFNFDLENAIGRAQEKRKN